VDLNEVRANLAQTPEQSMNSSISRRIEAHRRRASRRRPASSPAADAFALSDYRAEDPDFWLCPLNEADAAPLLGPPGTVERYTEPPAPHATASVHKRWRHGFLPLTLDGYLELLDCTARQWAGDKPGRMDPRLPPILKRLGLRPAGWLELLAALAHGRGSALGSASAMQQEATRRGRRWLQGIGRCRQAYL
jgi:hypothetical protein